MPAPKQSLSRSGKLLGTVGDRAQNRKADVALIQVLLADRRSRRGQPYYRGRITGQYDNTTAAALAQFRADAGDRTPTQPLRPGGPVLQKLAKGTDIAVMDGSTTAYKVVKGTAGRLTGSAAELSPERKRQLTDLLKKLSETWGIVFDLSVFSGPAPYRGLIGTFLPKRCAVRNAHRWCNDIQTDQSFRQQAPQIYRMIADDIRTKVAAELKFTDRPDLNQQARLKGQLAAVVWTELDWVLKVADGHLADFERYPNKLAARFFKHYLGATGGSLTVLRKDAMSFHLIRRAVEEAHERFRLRTFLDPARYNNTKAKDPMEKIWNATDPISVQFSDKYKYDFNYTSAAGLERYGRSAAQEFSLDNLTVAETKSFFFGPGSSSLTSEGKFTVSRQDDLITISGHIRHEWKDQGYNFDKGKIFYTEAQILERNKRAKPFPWKAVWTDNLKAEMKIVTPVIRGVKLKTSRLKITEWIIEPDRFP